MHRKDQLHSPPDLRFFQDEKTHGGITENASSTIDNRRQELTLLDLDDGFSEDRAGHHGEDGSGKDDGFDGDHVCV